MTATHTPVALTLSGSDPSGGAGLQADLKVFARHGVYGMAAVSLLTVQNTLGVRAVEWLDPDLLVAQADAALSDVPAGAIKTGSLGRAEAISAVARWYRGLRSPPPLLVDPVLVSKHGDPLADGGAVEALARELLPAALLVTPNLHEARALAGWPAARSSKAPERAERLELAGALLDRGAGAVLLKDGGGEGALVVDLLLCRGSDAVFWERPRLQTRSTHGSGCALSAAIAARLARGEPLPAAVAAGLEWVHRAIATAPGLGAGRGPLALDASP